MESRAFSEFVDRVRMLHARDELDATAVTVFEALAAAGVQALLLKGPALAQALYAADEHRGYGDIDLLLAPDALSRARRVLSGLGFADASARAVFGVDDLAGVQHAEIWSRGGELNRRPLMIDVHWRLPGWEAPATVTWDALAEGRTSIELSGRPVPVYGREALALHTATHAAQHGPGDLKALGDLRRGVDRWPPAVWQSAARLAASVDARAALAAGLRLLPSGADLADELALPSPAELTWSILHRDARPRGTFHVQALAEARGFRGRADIVRRSLLPTRLWIARRYPWADRGTAWLAAAYAVHVLNAPVWAARAWRFRRRAGRAAS